MKKSGDFKTGQIGREKIMRILGRSNWSAKSCEGSKAGQMFDKKIWGPKVSQIR